MHIQITKALDKNRVDVSSGILGHKGNGCQSLSMFKFLSEISKSPSLSSNARQCEVIAYGLPSDQWLYKTLSMEIFIFLLFFPFLHFILSTIYCTLLKIIHADKPVHSSF